jgi:hypothetical protein
MTAMANVLLPTVRTNFPVLKQKSIYHPYNTLPVALVGLVQFEITHDDDDDDDDYDDSNNSHREQ